MDLIDDANATADLLLAAALSRREPPRAKTYSHCRYCQEPLNPHRSFCDTDCRDDFEREVAAQKRNVPVE